MTARKKITQRPDSPLEKAAMKWYEWQKIAPFVWIANKRTPSGALFRACAAHRKGKK